MPSYQFNHFSGRLRESTHFQPLYPISAKPLETSDSQKMMYDTIKTKPVQVVANARSASGGVLPEKMLKTMMEYQKNIDTPVYRIRGTPDKIFFGFSVVVVGIGLGMMFEFIGRRAFPSKAQ